MKKIVLLCMLPWLPLPAFAQAPAPAAPPPPPPKQEGTAEFAFLGTTGNASTQTMGLNGTLIAHFYLTSTLFFCQGLIN